MDQLSVKNRSDRRFRVTAAFLLSCYLVVAILTSVPLVRTSVTPEKTQPNNSLEAKLTVPEAEQPLLAGRTSSEVFPHWLRDYQDMATVCGNWRNRYQPLQTEVDHQKPDMTLSEQSEGLKEARLAPGKPETGVATGQLVHKTQPVGGGALLAELPPVPVHHPLRMKARQAFFNAAERQHFTAMRAHDRWLEESRQESARRFAADSERTRLAARRSYDLRQRQELAARRNAAAARFSLGSELARLRAHRKHAEYTGKRRQSRSALARRNVRERALQRFASASERVRLAAQQVHESRDARRRADEHLLAQRLAEQTAAAIAVPQRLASKPSTPSTLSPISKSATSEAATTRQAEARTLLASLTSGGQPREAAPGSRPQQCVEADIAGWSGLELHDSHKALLQQQKQRDEAELSDLQNQLVAKGFTPGSPVFMRIFKDTSTLEVWLKKGPRFALFRSYQICRWSGSFGPKLYEGDKQSPEGFYLVDERLFNRPSWKWKGSFSIGYPNAYDKVHGRTGSLILVHGGCTSSGCFAMTDPVIGEVREIAQLARDNGQKEFFVNVYPFPLTDANMRKQRRSPWYAFWQNLKQGYDLFETNRLPPRVRVCGGIYSFSYPAASSEGGAVAASRTEQKCYRLTDHVPGWRPPRRKLRSVRRYSAGRLKTAGARRIGCNPALASCRKFLSMKRRKAAAKRRAARKKVSAVRKRKRSAKRAKALKGARAIGKRTKARKAKKTSKKRVKRRKKTSYKVKKPFTLPSDNR